MPVGYFFSIRKKLKTKSYIADGYAAIGIFGNKNHWLGQWSDYFIRYLFRCTDRKNGIQQDHFITCIDQEVLQTSAIKNVLIELVSPFFSTESKRLRIETML